MTSTASGELTNYKQTTLDSTGNLCGKQGKVVLLKTDCAQAAMLQRVVGDRWKTFWGLWNLAPPFSQVYIHFLLGHFLSNRPLK